MESKNTYALRTEDNNFRQALDEFLSSHCKNNDVNAVVFDLNEVGAKKVMAVVYEE